MDALPDGVLVVDDRGLVVFANNRLEVLSGYSRHELFGAPVELLVPQRLQSRHVHDRQKFQQASRLRPMGDGINIYLRRKDGSELPVDIQLSPIEISETRGTVASIRDLTERKTIEAALRTSEERYRMLVDTAPVLISTLSQEGAFISLNREFERITGYKREDWIGKHFSQLVDPTYVPVGFERLRRLAEGSSVETREVGVRTASGDRRILESVAVPLVQEGQVVAALGVGRDVTEIRAVERALRESEVRFLSVFENAPLGIVLVDQDDLILEVNNAMCTLLGYTRAELLGSVIFRFVHPDEHDDARARRRSITDGEVGHLQAERRWQTQSGDVIVSTITASMIHDADGAPFCGLLIVQDITQRRAFEDELASLGVAARETLSSLTPREREALALLCKGFNAKEIADRLVVSVRTVESHIASSYRKLKVHGKDEAVARFNRLTGIVGEVESGR
ncbi:MAG TPA: PAS domain S-box protein [Acidimicrobiales bacterium]|nr:PAS domain S-box protein [Acidimicrobiales bacterium]